MTPILNSARNVQAGGRPSSRHRICRLATLTGSPWGHEVVLGPVRRRPCPVITSQRREAAHAQGGPSGTAARLRSFLFDGERRGGGRGAPSCRALRRVSGAVAPRGHGRARTEFARKAMGACRVGVSVVTTAAVSLSVNCARTKPGYSFLSLTLLQGPDLGTRGLRDVKFTARTWQTQTPGPCFTEAWVGLSGQRGPH